MTVSVVTVAYNAAATVAEAVESVVSQKGDFTLDYHIVDEASTDDTLACIDPYRDRIAEVTSAPDQGLYDAMNRGLARAKGAIIGILNADDRYADQHVIADVWRPSKTPVPTPSTRTSITSTRSMGAPSPAAGNPATRGTGGRDGCRPTPPCS